MYRQKGVRSLAAFRWYDGRNFLNFGRICLAKGRGPKCHSLQSAAFRREFSGPVACAICPVQRGPECHQPRSSARSQFVNHEGSFGRREDVRGAQPAMPISECPQFVVARRQRRVSSLVRRLPDGRYNGSSWPGSRSSPAHQTTVQGHGAPSPSTQADRCSGSSLAARFSVPRTAGIGALRP
jgi:hypothetical protein